MEVEEGDNKRRMISYSLGGGGEITRIHIIYFLSRLGRIEHPHLIRVHHLAQNGVHLRDVKRWLSELRGKDMPDSFAWSYKRRYKRGYVWQDILDEDLITPISDNEYVLKGSDISAISSSFEPCLCGGMKASTSKPAEGKENNNNNKDDHQETKIIRNDEESPGPLDNSETSTSSSSSTTTDESTIFSMKSDSFNANPEVEVVGIQENENSIETEELEGIEDLTENEKEMEKKKKKGGGGATNVLRNLLNCRTIDTNDAAMMLINKDGNKCTTLIGEAESFGGGSQRISGGTCWNLQTQHQQYIRSSYTRERSSSRTDHHHQCTKNKKVSVTFKPVSEPHCSQCGKGFKPEKLHSHMKSCRGLKSSSKNQGVAAASCNDAAAGSTDTFA